MKITFIYLPHPYLRQPNAQVPLGILYLKSIIDLQTIIDAEVKNYSAYSIEEAINDLPESNIYGITVTSLELPMANDFAKLIKEKYPKSKVILGGPGIDQDKTFLDYVDLEYINSCIIGEGERIIFEIINDYKTSGHLKICYIGKSVKDLDDLPFPDRYCLGDNIGGNIFAYNKNYKGSGSTTILTSRGCPFKCLHGDTVVNTIEGKIKIKDLVGKETVKVMTRDLTTKEVLFADATNICKTSENEKLIRVIFDDDSYIDCTPDHRFMVFKNGNQFTDTTEKEVEAIDLKKGQSVRAIHYHKVKSVEFIKGLHDTYCMTVEGYDWFYANDVLVHNCSFCASPKFKDVKPVRFRSSQNVYEEIKEVKEKLGISQFRISDDMFLSRPLKNIEYMCDLLKDLDIVWRISTRVKPFTPEIAKLIKDAGCVEASFGVESFDDDVLRGLNKKTTAEDNVNALKVAADAGITSRVLFMSRTPFQSERTIDINIEYLEKTPYDIIACTSFVPLPGSDIWNNPDKYDIDILTKDLNKYNFYFWNKEGENELQDIIKLKGRDLDCLNQETKEFKEYLKSTGKLNMG